MVDDPASLGGVHRFPIDVKGDASPEISAAVSSMRRTSKRGIVVTRTVFDVRDDILVVPLSAYTCAMPPSTNSSAPVM